MDYSRKQLPPAPHPIRQPRQSVVQRITGGLLCLCVGVLLGEIALRLTGIRTPQSVFVIAHAASLWSNVVSLPWGYWFAVVTHLMAYSAFGIPLVVGLVLLKLSNIGTGNGWAMFFGLVSGSVEIVRRAVELSGRHDLKFTVQEPLGYKDWNDQLRRRPHPLLPYRPEVPSVT
jgi:hypothetical protein